MNAPATAALAVQAAASGLGLLVFVRRVMPALTQAARVEGGGGRDPGPAGVLMIARTWMPLALVLPAAIAGTAVVPGAGLEPGPMTEALGSVIGAPAWAALAGAGTAMMAGFRPEDGGPARRRAERGPVVAAVAGALILFQLGLGRSLSLATGQIALALFAVLLWIAAPGRPAGQAAGPPGPRAAPSPEASRAGTGLMLIVVLGLIEGTAARVGLSAGPAGPAAASAIGLTLARLLGGFVLLAVLPATAGGGARGAAWAGGCGVALTAGLPVLVALPGLLLVAARGGPAAAASGGFGAAAGAGVALLAVAMAILARLDHATLRVAGLLALAGAASTAAPGVLAIARMVSGG